MNSTEQPAVAGPVEPTVRPHLTVEFDHVGDALDDIADLCEHWKRNRERGRMPHALRADQHGGTWIARNRRARAVGLNAELYGERSESTRAAS